MPIMTRNYAGVAERADRTFSVNYMHGSHTTSNLSINMDLRLSNISK